MVKIASPPAQRELRLRIGRLRRRIDGRLHRLQGEAERLVAWPALLVRYPVRAIMMALDAAGPLAAGLRRGRPIRRLTRLVFNRTTRRLVERLVRGIYNKFRRKTTPKTSPPETNPPDTNGAEHGRE